MEEKYFRQEGRELVVDRDRVAMEVKKYRLRQQLTQKELGAQWGVSRYVIIRAETSKTITWESAYKIFAKLADALKEEGGQL